MPLIPNDPQTGKAKRFEDFSHEERLHWARQAFDEALGNKQRGWPIDKAAIARAKEFAKDDKATLDFIAGIEIQMTVPTQRREPPSAGLPS